MTQPHTAAVRVVVFTDDAALEDLRREIVEYLWSIAPPLVQEMRSHPDRDKFLKLHDRVSTMHGSFVLNDVAPMRMTPEGWMTSEVPPTFAARVYAVETEREAVKAATLSALERAGFNTGAPHAA